MPRMQNTVLRMLWFSLLLFCAVRPQAQTIHTVAGNGTQGFSGDGGLATSAQLWGPWAVAVDAKGNYYIADPFTNRIRRVDASTGIINTYAGGKYGFCGDGGTATAACLGSPAAVALDASGNLYIADMDNGRIRRVDASTKIITTYAGSAFFNYCGDNIPATSACLAAPRGVTVDAQGNVFIADTNNQRIRRVDGKTRNITTVAGNGLGGYNGDNINATSAKLNLPSEVAVDSGGNIFIADQSNYRIRRVDARTKIITTYAGSGIAGYSSGPCPTPGDGGPANKACVQLVFGLAVDGAGFLYIGDAGNSRVRMVNPSTKIITTIAGSGNSGYSGGPCPPSGDGGPANKACLDNPYGVAVRGPFVLQAPYPEKPGVGPVSDLYGTRAENGNDTAHLATYLYIADKDNFRIREVGIGTNCCGGYGTLGALVQKSGTFYILSNDHVLGRPTSLNVNSAKVGDPIVQPNSCNPFRTAANFASAPLLSSGVDAALATLVPGTMNTTGQINLLGIPASSTIPAAVGMNVAKSGATSGLTCGQVQGVNITVKITLTPDCFVAPPFPTQFSNVIAISVGSKFSQPGDSGSLIVSSSTAQPTALLFAGNSTYTWGFGIDRVLSAVGGATIVGGGQHAVAGCPAAATTSMEPILSENAITNATMAKEHYVRSLMQDPQVIGVGVGRGATNANVPAVLVFVNRQGSHRAVPATLDGVTTRVIATDPIQIETRCSALSR